VVNFYEVFGCVTNVLKSVARSELSCVPVYITVHIDSD